MAMTATVASGAARLYTNRQRSAFMHKDRRACVAGAITAPLFIPRSAWGANDRLAYGLIGAGGRGRYLNRNFQKLGAQCVAIAEVYDAHTQLALKDSRDPK